ncbi:hypothetical protein EUZ85_28940 [Hahella sp. KA22]|uniref:calcium-binding protein n=1 Tax=Hahella sp. KA22 TaxID=1628392 RepID=UPI000FDE8A49|nr:calcium-binding protein [Hahella sp. KA22]AZZ94523.1 hypothetical protein ENC22_26355 [Hahella sp. KA22]QAY57896.1 hypothetical protein EUZ85_28940 [Hahella sp. KA22]
MEGNKNSAQLSNSKMGATSSTINPFNHEFRLPEGSRQAFIGESDLEGDWTLEVLVKRAPDEDGASVLLNSPSTSIRLSQWGSNGKVGITSYGDKDHQFDYSAPVNEWVSLTIVRAKSKTYLYENGVLKDSLNVGVNLPLSTLSKDNRVADLDGSLGELRIWRYAKNANEVANTWNTTLNGNEEELYLWYDFREGEGTIVHDQSGNGCHAKLALGSMNNVWGDEIPGTGDTHNSYSFGYGSGQVEIQVIEGSNAETTKLHFGQGVYLDKLEFKKAGSDLIIGLTDSEDQITLLRWFEGAQHRIERFVFEDRWNGRVEYSAEEMLSWLTIVSEGGPGNDVLVGFEGIDSLLGGDGDDELVGLEGDDTLDGAAGADVLKGGGGNDYLFGGADDDVLKGGEGDDSLTGGAGDDILEGGVGNDEYTFGYGSGRDTLIENSEDRGDSLVFDMEVELNNLEFKKVGNDLVIGLTNSEDQITLLRWFEGAQHRIERFVFEDRWNGRVEYSAEEMLSWLTIVSEGGHGNDVLVGFEGVDSLLGGDGDDELVGLEGDDTLDGGAGADVLKGGDGNDYLFGGAGDDILEGGVGNDEYTFGYGSGRDTLIENSEDSGDSLVFDMEVELNNLEFKKVGNDLVIGLTDSEDQITLLRWFEGAHHRIERFVLEDRWNGRVEYSAEEMLSWLTIVSEGGLGNDVLVGFEGVDSLLGGDGDDELVGLEGDDTLDGGAGADVLKGGGGNDYLFGGADDDVLEGGEGDDSLTGGAGDDILEGGAGNDVYRFGYGAGRDTLIENSEDSDDSLVFDMEVELNNLEFKKVGNDLVIGLTDSEDQITLLRWFEGPQYRIEKFVTEDRWNNRVEYDAEEMVSWRTVLSEGGLGDDVLVGFEGVDSLLGGDDELVGLEGHDTLDGGAGNDVLKGGEGDDSLIGGAGDDTLYGGLGSDSYIFEHGTGRDFVIEDGGANGIDDTDKLMFGESIKATDLWLARDGNHLDIQLLGSSEDHVSIVNWYVNDSFQIEEIHTQDAMLDHSKVEALVNAMAAFGAPSGGEMTLTDEERSQVNAAIAAAWQPS